MLIFMRSGSFFFFWGFLRICVRKVFTNFLLVFNALMRLSKIILSYSGGGRHLYMVPERAWLSFNILQFGMTF